MMVNMNKFSTTGQLLPRNGIRCGNSVDEFQLQRGANLCSHSASDAGSQTPPTRFISTEHGRLTITVLSSGEATRALAARCPPAPSKHGLRSYYGDNFLADDRYGPCLSKKKNNVYVRTLFSFLSLDRKRVRGSIAHLLFAACGLETAFSADFPLTFANRFIDVMIAREDGNLPVKLTYVILHSSRKQILKIKDMEEAHEFFKKVGLVVVVVFVAEKKKNKELLID